MFPPATCHRLAERGHDAVRVRDRGVDARPDPEVAAVAVAEGRAIATENVKDFAGGRGLVLVCVLESRLPSRGMEIARPGSRHESLAILVSYLVAAVAEARDLDATSLGSTTFKDPGWERGFEPDACFYLRDAATVRGLERIDPRVDPPPEIVFEVDITRSSIDKLALYAQFGVAEVWRHDGEAATILVLDVERHGG